MEGFWVDPHLPGTFPFYEGDVMSKRQSEAQTRENNGNWKGGTSLHFHLWHGKLMLSDEIHKILVKRQEGLCAICGKPETKKKSDGTVYRLSVDHDHKTNKARGLLCTKCNFGLGSFSDDSEMLLKAYYYLERKAQHYVRI